MTDYRAPLNDMLFSLRAVAGLDDILGLSAYADFSADLVSDVLNQAARFAEDVLSPLNVTGDTVPARVEAQQVVETPGFKAAYEQFVEAGWAGISGDPAHGGSGFPELIAAATGEMWSSANMGFSLCPLLTQGAIGALKAHASSALQQAYLPNLIAGRWTGTMNLTEPQAGSDLAAIRTRAERDGDQYRITGTKIFITWGDHGMTENIIHLVLARLPDAPEGVKGISMFIVPKYLVNPDGSLGERNDVYPASVEHKLGIHGSPTCVLNLGENDGAIGYLIGEENCGLMYMFTMMNHARLHVGIEGVAVAARAYQHATAYARDRVQGVAPNADERGPIIRHADVRRMLLLMRALTEAGRGMSYLAAQALDNAHHHGDKDIRQIAQMRADLLIPIVKGWCTEVAQESTYLGMQIHGGMGYVEETGAAQYYRDARITTIYEGTTGIQANDLIGRKLIGNQASVMLEHIGLIIDSAERLAAIDAFCSAGAALREAASDLSRTCQWLVAESVARPCLPGSAAVNFLMQSGTVFSGWVMALSVLACHGQSDDFSRAKCVTAQFYFDAVLPRASMYRAAVMCGENTILAMDEDWF